jgi:hypothetical protein
MRTAGRRAGRHEADPARALESLRAEFHEEICELRAILLQRLPAAPEPTQVDADDFISVAEAARLAVVSKQAVRDWIRDLASVERSRKGAW